MVSVEHPDPPEEAKFNTESKGDVMPEADELSSGNEAHANFFGVFLFGNMATPNYPTVIVDRPEPGSPEFEALRTQAVIIQRLRSKLCRIEVLRQRVKLGCELDAAQHKSLRREAEVKANRDEKKSGSPALAPWAHIENMCCWLVPFKNTGGAGDTHGTDTSGITQTIHDLPGSDRCARARGV